MDTIWGIHAVREALGSGRPIQHIHFQQGLHNPRLRELMEECRSRDIPVRVEPGSSLDRLAQRGRHQGVVAVVAGHSYASLEDILECKPENALLLLLDGVQ